MVTIHLTRLRKIQRKIFAERKATSTDEDSIQDLLNAIGFTFFEFAIRNAEKFQTNNNLNIALLYKRMKNLSLLTLTDSCKFTS